LKSGGCAQAAKHLPWPRPKPARGRGAIESPCYRIKVTTIAIVSIAIVAINTLWPQRAINPSMLNLPVKIAKHRNLGAVVSLQ
jgi:hypothetical protein